MPVAAGRREKLAVREFDRDLPGLVLRRARRELRRARSLLGPVPAVQTYLDTHDVRKLQLGAGSSELPDWLNTDRDPGTPRAVYLDATHRFPLPDDSFDYVLTEHQIEHLSYRNGLFMLRECFRVLRPWGRIRIATPDLTTIAGLAASELNDDERGYVRWAIQTFVPDAPSELPAFAINNAFRNWGHRFLYDEATLSHALRCAGFTDIRRHQVGESDDERLQGLESHGVANGDEAMIRFETMVLEAARRTAGNEKARRDG